MIITVNSGDVASRALLELLGDPSAAEVDYELYGEFLQLQLIRTPR